MNDVRIVRVFVSAPADVETERFCVQSVAGRLNEEFSGRARFDILISDDEAYVSERALPTQVAEPSECDIVIGILWARLGTKLPPSFPLMPNREPYPSITAYELLTAIGARKNSKDGRVLGPDVHVFQKCTQLPDGQPVDVALLDLQWKLQKAFIDRALRIGDARVPSGTHDFATTEEFEGQLERLLREWISVHATIRVAAAAHADALTAELPAVAESQITIAPLSAPPTTAVAPEPAEKKAADVAASAAPKVTVSVAAPVPRRRNGFAILTTLVAIAIAGAAGFALHNALQDLNRSRKALDDAMATMSGLVEATSNATQPDASPDSIDALLMKARKAADDVASWSAEPRVVQQRARIMLNVAEINFARGRIERVSDDAAAASAMLEPLAKAGNLETRHMRAEADRLIAGVFREQGKNAEARQHYERAIADLGELLGRDGNSDVTWRWMRSLADLQQAYGDLMLTRFNEPAKALEAYDRSRQLRMRLAELGHKGPAFEHDLAWVTSKRAEVEDRLGQEEASLKLLEEARDRLDALKDRIWDNPRWAVDFATISSNIGLIKRRQNRFAEAAPIFSQAEDIYAAAYRRDPNNVDRVLMLNWVRFVRVENTFRWAALKNERNLMLEARERTKVVIDMAADIVKEAPQRLQAQIQKARADALMNAIDGTLRLWNGNAESAAAGFLAAVDGIEEHYLPHLEQFPMRDLVAEYVQYIEWAGMAHQRAQNSAEAEKLFRRAQDAAQKYQTILGPVLIAEISARLAPRLEQPRPQ